MTRVILPSPGLRVLDVIPETTTTTTTTATTSATTNTIDTTTIMLIAGSLVAVYFVLR